MKLLTLLLLIVTATTLTAQTKQIAHRSHSGAAETFSLSANPSNLGLSSEYYRIEPDTLQIIDSTETPPRATAAPIEPVPAVEPETPSEPEPPTEPEAVQKEPAKIKAAPVKAEERLEPGISKEEIVPSTTSPAQAYRENRDDNSLFWLAFGLFLPAVVIGAVSIRGRS